MSVFENDWIMRQIEGMTDMLGKVLLHREKSEIRWRRSSVMKM